jgi:uncharacterized protein YqfB (UPF0267 family)
VLLAGRKRETYRKQREGDFINNMVVVGTEFEDERLVVAIVVLY